MKLCDRIKGIKITTNLISAAGIACMIGPIIMTKGMNGIAKRNTENIFHDDKKENDKRYARKTTYSSKEYNELAKYHDAFHSSSSIEDIKYSYEEYLESYRY